MAAASKIIVTTSWDDGNRLDLKLAALLDKYNLKGTFYIPQSCPYRNIQDSEIKELGGSQEIGAHSLTHPNLKGGLSWAQQEKEISGSKQYLEQILGKKIKMFCYPGGKFTEETENLVKKAGFLGARTTKGFQIMLPDDLFRFGTTFRVFPLSFWQTLRFFKWSRLAKNLFNYALKNGEVYHLWGHSWEIEKYGMWEELEKISKYIANRKDVLYLTNSQTLEHSL